jgi:hypothetical protein
MLERIFQIGRGFGMIASRKRFERSLKKASKKMKRRTWLCSIRPRKATERILWVTVMLNFHYARLKHEVYFILAFT